MKGHWTLIRKFLKGHISFAEKEALEEWLNYDLSNRQKFEELKEVWELTGQFEEPVYDLEEEKQKLLRQIDSCERVLAAHNGHSRPNFNSLLTAAAMIFLLASTTFLAWMYYRNVKSVTLSVQIMASKHSVTNIDLPDSSRIYLHKESQIVFNQGSRQRIVDLKGEAYFEVKNDKRPFIIKIQQATVTVLGTSFNVKELNKDELQVTVVQGIVKVFDGQENNLLGAGEMALVNHRKKSTRISMNTNPNFLSWKTQKLVFDNTELKNVIYALSVYYDIKFEVNTPEILNCRFTGSFDNARLNTVMEVLKYSLGIDYSYDHNEYILSGKGCK